MPRDTAKAEVIPPARKVTTTTLSDWLDEADTEDTHVIPTIGKLAPAVAETAIPRSPRKAPVPDLSAMTRAWLNIGTGNTGKTLTARWFADHYLGDDAKPVALATVSMDNRALDRFASGVMTPKKPGVREAADFERRVLMGMAQRKMGGIIDCGGGDSATGLMIQSSPALVAEMEEQGLAIIAAYFFTPRVDDVTFLDTYEEAGFQPQATALILNLAKAKTPSAFDDVRRQPAYKKALDRGAVELWLPELPEKTALTIERHSLHFSNAKPALKLWERSELDRWLGDMEHEFSTVESWLPWT